MPDNTRNQHFKRGQIHESIFLLQKQYHLSLYYHSLLNELKPLFKGCVCQEKAGRDGERELKNKSNSEHERRVGRGELCQELKTTGKFQLLFFLLCESYSALSHA
jgi:hypothetical protein